MREQNVLLTGATGALGPSLAAELLAGDPTRTLDVLIRANGSSVSTRFNEWLGSVTRIMAEQHRGAPHWQQRVRPVQGDLRAANLGLTHAAADELRLRCTVIVHAAADTQFLSSYDDLRETNVGGTQRIIDFAHSCRTTPRLIQVSTVYTSGKQTGTIAERFNPTPIGFVNNYERTKWEAEQLSLSSRVPLGIARVSIVIGSHSSGTVDRMGAFHYLMRWFMRGLMPVIVGRHESPIDLISSETVAPFIARAVAEDWRPGSIWQIAAGARAGTLGELCELAWSEAFPGQRMCNRDCADEPFIVAQSAFDRIRGGKTSPRQRLVRQAMDSVSSFLPMFLYPRTYETISAEALWGGPLPHRDWRETLIRMISTWRRPARQESAA